MIKLALVGKSIQHSKSQFIYEKLLNEKIEYSLIDCEKSEDIPTAAKLLKEFDGVSITAPYKKHFLSEIDENYSPLEAINTLKLEDGKILAENTDYKATEHIIKKFMKNNYDLVYLLGDGVMAKLTLRILNANSVDVIQLCRSKNNLSEIKNVDPLKKCLIINACAREYIYNGPISSSITFWDMNYNLDHHVQLFKNTDCQYIDGMGLLELQAKYALSFWNLKDC